MRVPVTFAIFAVTAAVGTGIVIGPRIVASHANASRNTLSTGSDAPASPSASGAAKASAVARFRNKASGACLDSNGKGEVYVLGCNGGDFQKWRAVTNKDRSTTFRNLATGRCLDSNSSGGTSGEVYTLGCNGGDFQRWQIDETSGAVVIKDKSTKLCLWDAPGLMSSQTCDPGRAEFRWSR
jgi:hypothetical protein